MQCQGVPGVCLCDTADGKDELLACGLYNVLVEVGQEGQECYCSKFGANILASLYLH